LKKLNNSRKKFLNKKSLKIVILRRKRKHKKYDPTKFERYISRKIPEFVEIWAPNKLMLKYEEAENLLRFIKEIKKIARKGYFIDFKLDKVKEIGEGAIVMLLSVISDLESKSIFFRGKKPIDENAKNILEKSGFFNYMSGAVSTKNLISKNVILTTGNKNTHQEKLIPQIHQAMETVWGAKSRCPSLYGGLGEMMRNSCDHAFVNKSQIRWHLGISHFEIENSVKFSFVDNGAGILSTYMNKGILKKISAFFKDNADILETAFKDGIESRTGLSWRGKGLPTIFEMYSDKIITNLVIITNNVYLDFDRNIIKTISTKFVGTYYYWEINKTCTPAYFKIN
jgi:hypothetical protein